MIDDKNKDIVEEVFSRSKEADDRVSALFAHLKDPPQVTVALEEASPTDLKEPPAATDTDSSGNEPFQSTENTMYEILAEETIKNKKMPAEKNDIAVLAGSIVFVLVSIIGSYLGQHRNDPTTIIQEKQPVNRSEMVSVLETEPLINVPPEAVLSQPEPVAEKPEPVTGKPEAVTGKPEPVTRKPEPVIGKVNKNIPALNLQHFINWSRLLGEISSVIPKKVQLSVLESSDSSEMVLEGKALSTDAVYNFVDALKTKKQIKSAELFKTGVEKWKSKKLLTFSISCGLVSQTKTPGSIGSNENSSDFNRGRLFTSKQARGDFGSTSLVAEQTGCKVKSLLLSPKDEIFEDKQTNDRVIRKHAVLTLTGGYQNILKAVEKLQDRSQGFWFDSISIKQGSKTEGLVCSMGISVYIAEDAG